MKVTVDEISLVHWTEVPGKKKERKEKEFQV